MAPIGYFVLAGVGLAVLGSMLAGALVVRQQREHGRVRCVVSDWERTLPEDDPAGRTACSFEVALFNQGRRPTELRGVRVSLLVAGEGGREEEVVGPLVWAASGEAPEELRLPALKWAHACLCAVFEGEEARKLSGFRRATLVGHFPDGREFRHPVAGREYFVASRKGTFAHRKNFVADRKRVFVGRRDFVADLKRAAGERKDYRPWRYKAFGR